MKESRLFGQDVGGYPRHHFRWLIVENAADRFPLQVAFGGDDELVRGVWRSRENSEVCSLEYISEGVMEFIQDGARYECCAGDLFLIRPGADNTMRCLSPYLRKKTVCLDGELLNALLESLDLAASDVFRRLPEEVPQRFEEIFELLNAQSEEVARKLSAAAYGLLLLLASSGRDRAYPEDIRRILAYLETHEGEAITVESLSRRFGIGPRTLFRLFRRHLNQSPIDCLIALRMKRARRLLLEESWQIKEIAWTVGYRNALYFSHEFRRIVGMSPREFRERHRMF